MGGIKEGEVRRTESRLWIYFTWGSIASWSSSGREEPARPGPETSAMLKTMEAVGDGNAVEEEFRNGGLAVRCGERGVP